MIKHPTENSPESINMIALGPTNADYHGAHFRYDPVVPPVDEVWTVNKGFRTTKADLVFILDDLVGEHRQSRRYAKEIDEIDIPVITTILDEEVKLLYPQANLCSYPLFAILNFWAEVWLLHGGQAVSENRLKEAASRNACYLKNSIPMMLAYAGAIGVKTINLFGADYDFPGSSIHEADKPNTEYWIGACRFGLGMTINVSQRTTLLSTNQGRDIYGYGKRQPAL